MRIFWVVVLGILLTATTGLGQKADDSPSLEVTMKFIQEKMNAVGQLNYSISFHDTATGQNWVNRFSDEITKVVAKPEACSVSFHERLVVDDKPRFDDDDGFDLKQVQSVLVLTLEQDLKKHGKNPTWERKTDPALWSLWVSRSDNNANSIYFRDEETAERVAKAVRHAAQLCGGKVEPF